MGGAPVAPVLGPPLVDQHEFSNKNDYSHDGMTLLQESKFKNLFPIHLFTFNKIFQTMTMLNQVQMIVPLAIDSDRVGCATCTSQCCQKKINYLMQFQLFVDVHLER